MIEKLKSRKFYAIRAIRAKPAASAFTAEDYIFRSEKPGATAE